VLKFFFLIAQREETFSPVVVPDVKSPTAATLEATYNKAINEKKDTEKKINQAELLHEQLSTLKTTENYISPKDLMELRAEIKTDETLILKSSALHREVDNLEKQICKMGATDDFLNVKQQLQEEINIAKDKLQKAITVITKISAIHRNPDFLPLSGIEKLKEELGKVQTVFKNISLQGPSMEAGLDAILKVQNEARDELECVVCLEVPLLGVQVFSCLQHHLLCSDCAKKILQSCPVCRQNFKQNPPIRNRLAEKMIQRLG
jgi:flavin-binding protein dodecin